MYTYRQLSHIQLSTFQQLYSFVDVVTFRRTGTSSSKNASQTLVIFCSVAIAGDNKKLADPCISNVLRDSEGLKKAYLAILNFIGLIYFLLQAFVTLWFTVFFNCLSATLKTAGSIPHSHQWGTTSWRAFREKPYPHIVKSAWWWRKIAD